MGKNETKSAFVGRHGIFYYTVTLEETSNTFEHITLSSGDRRANSWSSWVGRMGWYQKPFHFFHHSRGSKFDTTFGYLFLVSLEHDHYTIITANVKRPSILFSHRYTFNFIHWEFWKSKYYLTEIHPWVCWKIAATS